MHKDIKECNELLGQSESEVLMSYFSEAAAASVNNLINGAKILLDLFVDINTMLDVMCVSEEVRLRTGISFH